MKQWEYLMAIHPERDELADLGQKRWELVAVLITGVFWFKREIDRGI